MIEVMKPPPEFYRFVRAFALDRPPDVKDLNEWIATALQRFDPAGRQALKQFLIDLLRQNRNEAELQDLWKSAGISHYVVGKHGNDGVRTLLTMVRDAIE